MPTAPYGSWTSPITADLIVSSTVSLGSLSIDGDDLYWLEGRPLEGGRQVLVRMGPDGSAADVTPASYNVRTRVHEYGGGSYRVQDGVVFFANFVDQKLYRLEPGSEPVPFTHSEATRFADMVLDSRRGLMLAVREDHSGGGEPVNSIVGLSLSDGAETTIAEGHDFFSSPRLSPNGKSLAWLSWDHPNMPWDGTDLWLAELDPAGHSHNAKRVAGGPRESIFQPEWSPDGRLYFCSDRSGWWNLYRLAGGRVEAVLPREAEFGHPAWAFDSRTYGFLQDGRIFATYAEDGSWRAGLVDPEAHSLTDLDIAVSPSGPCVNGNLVYFLGSSKTVPGAIYSLDLASAALEPLRWTTDIRIAEAYLSVAEAVDFPTESGLKAHGFFYAPKNGDFEAPPGEKPPLIVMSHGGPTSAAGPGLSPQKQFWTSRGFAVLDVNYGGSSGYGRLYRERLNGRWGIVDVDDCVNGARYLDTRGLIDPQRMAITGGSAGGYTTLCALAFRDVFKAGASYYGVGDLEALALDTHKFESRYLDGLVGPYPERRDLYVERSPIHHVDQLSCPAIFFQGLEDRIVPPNQAESMVEALRRKGIPVAYLPFEGEQHGFRRAANMKRALEAELYFYGRVFRFSPADDIEPVTVDNL
jgi:dipeptidyl aminopeptidase/acylaminoacyl peptidase